MPRGGHVRHVTFFFTVEQRSFWSVAGVVPFVVCLLMIFICCLVYQAFSSTPSLTPDDDVFQHLASVYARNHATMHLGLPCKPGSPSFPNGTTNGAAWYPLTGGVQDYSYVWAGTLEITVEMSCCKYPPAAELPIHWSEHRQVSIA